MRRKSLPLLAVLIVFGYLMGFSLNKVITSSAGQLDLLLLVFTSTMSGLAMLALHLIDLDQQPTDEGEVLE